MLITRELRPIRAFFHLIKIIFFSFHPILNNVSQNIKVQGEVYHFVNELKHYRHSLKTKKSLPSSPYSGIKGKDFCRY